MNNIQIGKYTIPISERPCIMGVLNVTPDSFSDGEEYMDFEKAVSRGIEMAEEGADIIDIGGESSRPGAEYVTASEEKKRVLPVVEMLARKISIPISVDTRKSGVAREALEHGASIINDISALHDDAKMADVISASGAAVVLMHKKGDPKDMQKAPFYNDVMDDIISYLVSSVEEAVSKGVDPSRIIIDPGIGFGKRLEDNLTILKRLRELKTLGRPVLVGVSRKSFIGDITGRGVKERMFGTAASITAAVINGADIIRVHDVKDMKDAVTVAARVARA